MTRKPVRVLLSTAAVLCGLSLFVASAAAQEASEEEILKLIDEMGLEDQKKSDIARAKLIEIGEPAVPHLVGEVMEGESIIVRGWCVVALSEIGGEEVMKRLAEIQADEKQPPLVRTWAAAAQVYQAESVDELVKLAPLVGTYPALGRPIGMKLIERLADKDKPASAEQVIEISLNVPQLQGSLAPTIMAFGVDKLSEVMTSSENVNTAQQATAYLASMGQGEQRKEVADAVLKAYKFDAEAKAVPWKTALWVPMIAWDKEPADKLIEDLITWWVWAEFNLADDKIRPAQNQIHNNIMGVTFNQIVGYQTPNFDFNGVTTEQWLTAWGKAVGKERLQKALKNVGDKAEEKYGKVAEAL